MRRSARLLVCVGAAFSLFTGAAGASTVSVEPDASQLLPGAVFDLRLVGAFDEPTAGGSTRFLFDAAIIAYTGTIFAPPWDFFSVVDETLVASGQLDFQFGVFPATTFSGELATLSFTVAGDAGAGTDIDIGLIPPDVGWSGDEPGEIIDVRFQGARVQVVPIPAALWLFAAAAGFVFGTARSVLKLASRPAVMGYLADPKSATRKPGRGVGAAA